MARWQDGPPRRWGRLGRDRMRPPKCPICDGDVTAKPGVAPFPFCSPRCKLVDLGNWIDGRYVVRGDADSDRDEDEAGPPRHAAVDDE